MERDVTITLVTIDQKAVNLTLRESQSVLCLKKIIFQKGYQQLEVDLMALIHQTTVLPNNLSLGTLYNKNATIKQVKAELRDIPNLHFKDKECQFSGEKGVVELSCGHEVGRGTLEVHAKNRLKQGFSTIDCPYYLSGNTGGCEKALDFTFVTRVLASTLAEATQMSQKLSMNYLTKASRQCPLCRKSIIKLELKTNRVKCLACGHGDFCYECSSPWTGSTTCNSKECNSIADYIAKSPRTRLFKLTNQSDQTQKDYATPQARACPSCFSVIEHIERCKHTLCPKCSKSFCWVCLAVKDQNGTWPCGKAYDYCGSEAPNQKLVK